MSESLFQSFEPLASRMRPSNLVDIIGQESVVQILSNLKKPISMIFYGPPGTGKTSIAKLLSDRWKFHFRALSAISAGVKEVKEIIQEAQKLGNIVLFLDEIHRFNSSQQDSLLEVVESGRIILIGATTENPAFRVNRALLSRLQIFKLNSLNSLNLKSIYRKAKEKFHLVDLDESCLDYLINASSQDARRFLGLLELIDNLSPKNDVWDKIQIEEILYTQVLSYDKNKESHYDYISAMIKSIRGSDPDAALLYLSYMLEAGEDPLFILRRLVILASEDVGNASIYGLIFAESALSAFERIGMPEGKIIISQVVTFLASCPKSNASYNAIRKAEEFVKNRNGNNFQVPLHLRNAPTFLHKREGNSANYKYPHDFSNGFVEEFYFPDELKKNPPQFYFPTDRGTEKNLKDRLKSLWVNQGIKNYPTEL